MWRYIARISGGRHLGGQRPGVQALGAPSGRRADWKAHATHYFETTSHAFFAKETDFLKQRGIDVTLIYGLHTYGQRLA